MDNKIIKLRKNNKDYIKGVLTIWEEAPNNESYVMLELKFENNCYKIPQENFF